MKRLALLIACTALLASSEARAQSGLDVGLELAGGTAGSITLGAVGIGAGLLVGILESDTASLWTDVAIWTVLGGSLGAGLGGWLGVTKVAHWRSARGDGDRALYGAAIGFLVGLAAVAIPIGLGLAQEHEGLLRMGAYLALPAVLAPGIGATIGFNTGRKELMSFAPGPVRSAEGTVPGLVMAAVF